MFMLKGPSWVLLVCLDPQGYGLLTFFALQASRLRRKVLVSPIPDTWFRVKPSTCLEFVFSRKISVSPPHPKP